MAQIVEYLTSKYKDPSSIPSTAKKAFQNEAAILQTPSFLKIENVSTSFITFLSELKFVNISRF
jgi:glutathione S-transferase